MLQEITYLKDKVQCFQGLPQAYEDAHTLWELATEEEDESMAAEIASFLRQLEKKIDQLELDMLLSGPYDSHGAILSLHAGTGGTEAQDWCEMLYRMYQRYADSMGFKCEVLDFLGADEAGIKSVTLAVNGKNAYGYLKSEKGVHRLVRMSPFDASASVIPLLPRWMLFPRWKMTMKLRLTRKISKWILIVPAARAASM